MKLATFVFPLFFVPCAWTQASTPFNCATDAASGDSNTISGWSIQQPGDQPFLWSTTYVQSPNTLRSTGFTAETNDRELDVFYSPGNEYGMGAAILASGSSGDLVVKWYGVATDTASGVCEVPGKFFHWVLSAQDDPKAGGEQHVQETVASGTLHLPDGNFIAIFCLGGGLTNLWDFDPPPGWTMLFTLPYGACSWASVRGGALSTSLTFTNPILHAYTWLGAWAQ
ncbi:MAG: hypothetical protein WBX02_18385 [Terriglobales bacterium]